MLVPLGFPGGSEGFPGGSEVKASACNEEDLGSIPGLGRSPGEGNGNPLQYSCLGNSMDRGTWWAVHGVTERDITNTSLDLEMQETWFDPWIQKGGGKWQPTPVFLSGKFRGQRSLVGYSPRGLKESDTTERLHFHFLSSPNLFFLPYSQVTINVFSTSVTRLLVCK